MLLDLSGWGWRIAGGNSGKRGGQRGVPADAPLGPSRRTQHSTPDSCSRTVWFYHHFLRRVTYGFLCRPQTHVKEGELVSQCGRRYPIEDAIPNMLLKEDEVPGEPPAAEAADDSEPMGESEHEMVEDAA